MTRGMNRQSLNATLVVILVPCAFLVLLGIIVGERELFSFINQGISNPFLDLACVYGSPILFATFYIFTLANLIISRKASHFSTIITSMTTGPLSYVLGSLIKLLVERPRPFTILENVRVIGPWDTSSFSFPSTTTMLAFGLAIPVLLLNKKRQYGIVLSVSAYFMGFSVIYTGFHFPTDVAAGILLSLSIALITSKAYDYTTKHLKTISQKQWSSLPTASLQASRIHFIEAPTIEAQTDNHCN